MLQTNSSKIGGKAPHWGEEMGNKQGAMADGPKATGSFIWFDMNLPYWAKSQMQLSFKRMEISQVSLTQHTLNHCSVGILPLASKRSEFTCIQDHAENCRQQISYLWKTIWKECGKNRREREINFSNTSKSVKWPLGITSKFHLLSDK